MKKDSSHEVEALKTQLVEIQEKLKSLGDSVQPEISDDVKDYVASASTALKDYLEQTTKTVKEKWEAAQESGKNTGKKVNDYAQENPWHVAAAGALIGVAVASLLHNRDKE